MPESAIIIIALKATLAETLILTMVTEPSCPLSPNHPATPIYMTLMILQNLNIQKTIRTYT